MKNVRTAEIVYPPEVDGNKMRIKRSVRMETDKDEPPLLDQWAIAVGYTVMVLSAICAGLVVLKLISLGAS